MGSTSNIAIDAASSPQPVESKQSLKKRTPGMWVFDSLVYPLFSNTSVFLLSVLITYKSNLGGRLIAEKMAAGMDESAATAAVHAERQWGEGWLEKRRVSSGELFKKLGVTKEETQKNYTMIAWSFLDGCLIAPVVAAIEHFRSPLAHKLDEKMGTVPSDPNAYEHEGKQTWKTLIGGRATAAAVVVPVAIALQASKDGNKSWNARVLEAPGEKLGMAAEKAVPSLGKAFRRVPYVGEVVVFEAFWTTVCTAALYVASHYLFVSHPKAATPDNAPTPNELPAQPAPAPAPVDAASPQVVASSELLPETPSPRVSTEGVALKSGGLASDVATTRAEKLMASREQAGALPQLV